MTKERTLAGTLLFHILCKLKGIPLFSTMKLKKKQNENIDIYL